MKKEIKTTITQNELETLQSQTFGAPVFFSIKAEDKDGNLFADAYLSARFTVGRVYFYLTHEKGYPSQQKGFAERQIRSNWISNELPK